VACSKAKESFEFAEAASDAVTQLVHGRFIWVRAEGRKKSGFIYRWLVRRLSDCPTFGGYIEASGVDTLAPPILRTRDKNILPPTIHPARTWIKSRAVGFLDSELTFNRFQGHELRVRTTLTQSCYVIPRPRSAARPR